MTILLALRNEGLRFNTCTVLQQDSLRSLGSGHCLRLHSFPLLFRLHVSLYYSKIRVSCVSIHLIIYPPVSSRGRGAHTAQQQILELFFFFFYEGLDSTSVHLSSKVKIVY